jgi:hypothetical protein
MGIIAQWDPLERETGCGCYCSFYVVQMLEWCNQKRLSETTLVASLKVFKGFTESRR